MGSREDSLNTYRPGTIVFSEDWDTSQLVMREGVEVSGVIKACKETRDPHDDEHTIFTLEYEYDVDSRVFKKKLTFSINTVHIAYGYSGGLLHTPKFKYSLDDFRNSMQPGQTLKIRTLNTPPYSYIVEPNEVMAEVMRHEAVWT
jgi:hypothetical protein